MKRFDSLVKVIERNGGKFYGDYADLVPESNGFMLRTEEEHKKIARDRTLSRALLQGSDANHYGQLMADLANDDLRKHPVHYPETLAEAFQLLLKYFRAKAERERQERNKPQGPSTTKVDPNAAHATFVQTPQDNPTAATAASTNTSLTQVGTPVPGTDGVLKPYTQCYGCGKNGHCISACPTPTATPAAATTDQGEIHSLCHIELAMLQKDINQDSPTRGYCLTHNHPYRFFETPIFLLISNRSLPTMQSTCTQTGAEFRQRKRVESDHCVQSGSIKPRSLTSCP